MTPGDNTNMDIRQLRKDLEALEASNPGQMSDYHRDLLRWARNVDRRYAWVVLAAAHLMLMGTLGPYRVYSLIFAAVAKEGVYTREQASWPVSMIFTLENLVGPLVSIIVYYISFRKSQLIGGLLLSLSNLAAFYSNSLFLDTLFIGVIQGVGYAFLFMPFMEIINGYFVKNRSLALGVALCGGTLSNFILLPIFRWILANHHWRTGYLGTFCITCLTVLMVPLMKPNMRPIPPIVSAMLAHKPPLAIQQSSQRYTTTRMSMRSLVSNQAHQQRLSRSGAPGQVLAQAPSLVSRQASVVSINPFATIGRSQKVSSNLAVINATATENNTTKAPPVSPSQVVLTGNKTKLNSTLSQQSRFSCATIDQYEQMSLNDALDDEKRVNEPTSPSDFDTALIWDILKTPAFHLIWLIEVLYFWLFSIMCLIIVDFGVDHQLSKTDAESLMNFISIGELIGRLFLSYLADLNLASNRKIVTLDLVVLGSVLTFMTQTNNYYYLAACSLLIFAFTSLLYLLINVLLVEYLGERQVTLGYGFSSFIGGALIIPRPHAVGYFRDHLGTYDPLIICIAAACLIMAALWTIEPLMTRLLTRKRDKCREGKMEVA